MKKTLDDIYTSITYQISSCLGSIDTSRYNQSIFGDIIEVDEYGNKKGDIGRILANKLLLGEACNNGWDIFSICDTDHQTCEVGEVVYDFEENEFVEPIKDFFHDLEGNDILILNRIEIYPEYRGMGIGKFVIKDLYNNFIQGCALFVLKSFPLQLEAGILDRNKEHAIKMGYAYFEKDNSKSFKKLHSYYKSLGFLNIPAISKNYMFINSALKNKKFQSVVLD